MKRNPSLGRMLFASMALHLVFLVALGISGLLRARDHVSSSPYVVRLVPGPATARESRSGAAVTRPPKPEPPPPRKEAAKAPSAKLEKPARPSVPVKPQNAKKEMLGLEPATRKPAPSRPTDDQSGHVEAEIQRMERIKQVERLSRLRGTVGAVGPARESETSVGTAPEKQAVYYGLVEYRVKENWFYTGPGKDDLMTEVLIVIGKNGGVLQQKIVKGSGIVEFDRSVLRAIAKASPFPQPPVGIDTEIQFRFCPSCPEEGGR